ncbi:MAG: hypothetical protein BGN96_04205 [Bacteroidales bacterium 45-6]|nr:MAG: hypothetical protein BGN96_04205 [Bacteroidales bacterium 45-6]
MKRNLLTVALLCPFFLFSLSANSQTQAVLSLDKAIKIATDSSLTAFKAKNLYLSGYWQYRTFKAGRLPSVTLGASPFGYCRNIVKRYDSQNNVDVYKSQQNLNSSASITLSQNVDLTGGTFFVDSYLSYIQNYGVSQYKQYSSVPFRLGYSQSLFGFNSFKWDKRIEPLRYERVKKELTYNLETISEQTAQYFFDLALNQAIHHLSKQNLANNDTLYRIGQERYKVGSISQPDLLTLKLNLINSQNELRDAEISHKSSTFKLTAYLHIDKGSRFELELPSKPLTIFIPVDQALKKAKENNPTYLVQKENVLTAQKAYEKAQKENRFSASMSASIGFNQIANSLPDTYKRLLRQDVVSVSLTVPILDWGVSKGKVNTARSDMNVSKISAKETEQSLEQEVLLAVEEFNDRQSRIGSEEEAKQIAQQAYEKTRQLFLIGKTNVDAINQAQSRQIEAEINYVTSLKNYWLCYYKIRRLTLYDFATDTTISTQYEQAEEF